MLAGNRAMAVQEQVGQQFPPAPEIQAPGGLIADNEAERSEQMDPEGRRHRAGFPQNERVF